MAHNNSFSYPSRLWREAAIFVFAAALFLTIGLSGFSQDSDKPADSDKPLIAAHAGSQKGNQIFNTRCIVCHNKQPGDNSPFGPPNLFDVFKTKTITAPQAEQIITHGKGQMPAFNNVLSKSEMDSVIAYLKSGKA